MKDDEFDTKNIRYKAAAREEFGRLGALVGEILYFNEQRAAGRPLPEKDRDEGC